LLRKRSARRWPRRISLHPSTRWGPAATSTEIPRLVAEGGAGRRNKTPIPPRGIARGPRSHADTIHRVEPHAEYITQGGSGIQWAEKWPLIGILLECRNPGSLFQPWYCTSAPFRCVRRDGIAIT